MRLLKRRTTSGTRVDFSGSSLEDLRAEIARLREANVVKPSRDAERRLLRLRHLAGMRVLDGAPPEPHHAEPDHASLPDVDGLPEIAAADVTPELLRAGILRDGCLLVRGLVPRETALDFANDIDRSFEERERGAAGESPAPGYYEEFTPDSRFGAIDRDGRYWIQAGGGLLAADSPRLAARMMELFEAAGLPSLVERYLGEPGLITLQKTTLRKADPAVGGAWHQDGHFLGDVRALNLWLSLSRCGDVAPGLDVVPRRLDTLVAAATDEAVLSFQVSQEKAEAAAGDTPIVRPVFEPGDALFFDDLFLHQTGSDPSMPNPRYAIENWFFGGSAFPAEYAPIAV